MQLVHGPEIAEENLAIPLGRYSLNGDLMVPAEASGLVLFAHGSGSNRQSSRNQMVAAAIRERGLGTLLFDLLTPSEAAIDGIGGEVSFNVELLAERLIGVTEWVFQQGRRTAIGYFGSSTGAAAALMSAGHFGKRIKAVVSRGGRPDLAGDTLGFVQAPTLLIVGGKDLEVVELNQEAMRHLRCEKEIRTVSGATHLFEEKGALEQVAELAGDWFDSHCASDAE